MIADLVQTWNKNCLLYTSTLTGILPVIAPGISVPTFVNNVLAEHMEKYRDIIDETCHRKFKEMMVWKDSSICR